MLSMQPLVHNSLQAPPRTSVAIPAPPSSNPMARTPSPATNLHTPLPTHLSRAKSYLCMCTVLIIAAIIRRADAQRLTFERCETNEDCTPAHLCLGKFKNTDAIIPCQPELSKECFCLTGSFNYCDSHARCSKGEVCAVNPKTGSQLCVGCAVVEETARNFTAVGILPVKNCAADGSAFKVTIATPTPTPTPAPIVISGKAYDACSTSLPCASGFSCTGLTTSFSCSPIDLICTCLSAEIRKCTAPSDCESGETCCFDSFFNTTECTGCTFANDHMYQHPLSPDKCKGVPKRPKPSYLPTPNGLSYDPCKSDLTCKPPLRCRREDFKLCEDTLGPCVCLPPKSFQGCEKSQECQHGELCVRHPPGSGPVCRSRFSLIILESIGYDSLGKENPAPPVPNTTGHRTDPCRYDWDCQEQLRCTHWEDNLIGGCAGRRACECKRIQARRCQGDQDCDPGAVCVNFADSSSHPFCLSPKTLRLDSDFVPFTANRSTFPRPLWGAGLTGDVCHNDADCVPVLSGESRVCRHLSEKMTPCDRRNSCYCRVPSNQNCASSSDCETGEICTNVKDAIVVQPVCRSQVAVSKDVYDLYDEVFEVSPRGTPVYAITNAGTGIAAEDSEGDAGDSLSKSELNASAEPMEGDATPSAEPTFEASTANQPSCIAASALAHLPRHALVFADSVHAVVLCDLDANCATPGHIVVHRGRAMMMQTYCQGAATCVRRTMLVNSPRMQRGLRVASRTQNFEYTALAARFETSIEEHVLTRLVHLGL